MARLGVEVRGEYDNDKHNSLTSLPDVFEVPIWSPTWANKILSTEAAFKSISKEEYTDSLICTACCGSDCTKFSCDWLCGDGGEDEKSVAEKYSVSGPDDIRMKTMRSVESPPPRSPAAPVSPMSPRVSRTESSTRAREQFRRIKMAALRTRNKAKDWCARMQKISCVYSLVHLFHVVLRLPLFHASIALAAFVSVFFRFARRSIMVLGKLLLRCNVCGTGTMLHTMFLGFVRLVLTPMYLTITAPVGIVMHWSDILVGQLIFRPLIALGRTAFVAARNNRGEPLSLRREVLFDMEQRFEDWAWGAVQMVDDPDELELFSQSRVTVMNPTLLLTSYSIVASITVIKGFAEMLGPFLLQTVVLYIVTTSLADGEDVDGENRRVRQLAAFGAFVYYLAQASESAGKFCIICRSHVNNAYLFIDFVSNVVYIYIIVPLAVNVVLNSEGIDIVFNLLALEFVCQIDESLFDEASKFLYQGPYAFHFHIKDIPRYVGGIACPTGDVDPTVVVEVYYREETCAIFRPGQGPVPINHWCISHSTSKFSADVKTHGNSGIVLDMIKRHQWYQDTPRADAKGGSSAGPDSKESKAERSKSRVVKQADPNHLHLSIDDIPPWIGQTTLIEAIQSSRSLSRLGKVILLAFKVDQDALGRAPVSQSSRKAFAFFERPDDVPEAFYALDGNPDDEVTVIHRGRVRPLRISLCVPFDRGNVAGRFKPLENIFRRSLRSKFTRRGTVSGQDLDVACANHIRVLGKVESKENADSRVLMFWDFPFVGDAKMLDSTAESKGSGIA